MSSKPPLTSEVLCQILDLTLLAGQILLQHGAETDRIEETLHRLGTGLGCDWMDILVTPDGIIITAHSHGEFRTKTRRVVRMTVNMSKVSEVNDLSHQVSAKKLHRQDLAQKLTAIIDEPLAYPRWIIVSTSGMACGAFSMLFGGDAPAFFITFLAAAVAMYARQEMEARYFNPLMTSIFTAFLAGLIAGGLPFTETQISAISSSVLMLIPGVPFINATEDLLKGYVMTGMARGGHALLVTLCIALGLLLSISITRVTGL